MVWKNVSTTITVYTQSTNKPTSVTLTRWVSLRITHPRRLQDRSPRSVPETGLGPLKHHAYAECSTLSKLCQRNMVWMRWSDVRLVRRNQNSVGECETVFTWRCEVKKKKREKEHRSRTLHTAKLHHHSDEWVLKSSRSLPPTKAIIHLTSQCCSIQVYHKW